MHKRDILIVGQGLAGSLLALELEKRGKKVMILDNNPSLSASKVAAGLYNPITGRKMVKTWFADELFPNLSKFYQDLEKKIDAKFHFSKTIYRPFNNIEEQNDWSVRKNFITNKKQGTKVIWKKIDRANLEIDTPSTNATITNSADIGSDAGTITLSA